METLYDESEALKIIRLRDSILLDHASEKSVRRLLIEKRVRNKYESASDNKKHIKSGRLDLIDEETRKNLFTDHNLLNKAFSDTYTPRKERMAAEESKSTENNNKSIEESTYINKNIKDNNAQPNSQKKIDAKQPKKIRKKTKQQQQIAVSPALSGTLQKNGPQNLSPAPGLGLGLVQPQPHSLPQQHAMSSYPFPISLPPSSQSGILPFGWNPMIHLFNPVHHSPNITQEMPLNGQNTLYNNQNNWGALNMNNNPTTIGPGPWNTGYLPPQQFLTKQQQLQSLQQFQQQPQQPPQPNGNHMPDGSHENDDYYANNMPY